MAATQTRTHLIGFRSRPVRAMLAGNPDAAETVAGIVAQLQARGVEQITIRPAAYIGGGTTPLFSIEAHHWEDNGWPRGRSWTTLRYVYRSGASA